MADFCSDDRMDAIFDNLDGRGAPGSILLDATTILRLANLDPLAYDRCREAEAVALNIRVTTLDREVQIARADIRRQQARQSDNSAPAAPPRFSDDAIACRFSDRHANSLLYVPAWNHWLVFQSGRWTRDPVLTVFDKARMICREVAADATGEKDGASIAQAITSAKTVAAVERIARSDPRHARPSDAFDADPMRLNTPGGVVDLWTGHMMPHSPADLFTKVTAVAPGGKCTKFLRFLFQITKKNNQTREEQKATIRYLQRFIGYTLTGQIREHAFLFLYGPGKNGKGVLMNTIAYVLGDYAQAAMADVFTLSRGGEGHASKLATLRGARMVAVSETEEGRPWAEARIKAWTGGDKVSANFMHGNPFEFTPVCKLWFSGNHKPPLRNPDAAMRRRMHLLPLTYIPDVPDLGLQAALQTEAGGILAWAIVGCQEWIQKGLQPPKTVTEATDEYFLDQNNIEGWIAARCERLPDAQVAVRALYQDWRRFMEAGGTEPQSEKWFSGELEKQFVKLKTKKGMAFKGIAFRPPPNKKQADGEQDD